MFFPSLYALPVPGRDFFLFFFPQGEVLFLAGKFDNDADIHKFVASTCDSQVEIQILIKSVQPVQNSTVLEFLRVSLELLVQ